MGSVTANEHAPIAEPVCNKPPTEPVFLADHLVFEIVANTQNVTDTAIPVGRVEILFVVPQIIVYQPKRLAIDRMRVPERWDL